MTSLKPVLHLSFAAILAVCFAGSAFSHCQQGHVWLSLSFLGCGGFYVSQAMGRFRASRRSK